MFISSNNPHGEDLPATTAEVEVSPTPSVTPPNLRATIRALIDTVYRSEASEMANRARAFMHSEASREDFISTIWVRVIEILAAHPECSYSEAHIRNLAWDVFWKKRKDYFRHHKVVNRHVLLTTIEEQNAQRSDSAPIELADPTASFETIIEIRWLIESITVPADRKLVAMLLAELTPSQIAIRLNISNNTASQRSSRLREKLREAWYADAASTATPRRKRGRPPKAKEDTPIAAANIRRKRGRPPKKLNVHKKMPHVPQGTWGIYIVIPASHEASI